MEVADDVESRRGESARRSSPRMTNKLDPRVCPTWVAYLKARRSTDQKVESRSVAIEGRIVVTERSRPAEVLTFVTSCSMIPIYDRIFPRHPPADLDRDIDHRDYCAQLSEEPRHMDKMASLDARPF